MKSKILVLLLILVSSWTAAANSRYPTFRRSSPNFRIFAANGVCTVNADIPSLGYVTAVNFANATLDTTEFGRLDSEFWFSYLLFQTTQTDGSGALIRFAAPVIRRVRPGLDRLYVPLKDRNPTAFLEDRVTISRVEIGVEISRIELDRSFSGTLLVKGHQRIPLSNCYGVWK